ncbi:MAG: cysteine hydrolase family protein [Candidatus Kapaibacterium sp.]
MVALLIIDMQVGLFNEPRPRHDADGVIRRINALSAAVRASGGIVIFIQHDGPPGDTFQPETAGWRIVPELERNDNDAVVHKRSCDAFCETELSDLLSHHHVKQLLITGCATDFCVDTTIRAGMSLEYDITVVEDGHTTADRPHMDAVSVIRHHNWVWENLIHPRTQVKVLPAERIISGMLPEMLL